MEVDKEAAESSTNLASRMISELYSSPLNLALLAAIGYVVYKIFSNPNKGEVKFVESKQLPKLKKQDMTMEQLKQYNGLGPDGRVLVAINGKIFDCTRGKRFYGPGGPYAAFAGRDASRGMATFSIAASDEYDDLSNLSFAEKESVREWEMQFTEKYEYVGKLLKPGETPSTYPDEEAEGTVDEQAASSSHPKAE